MYHVARYEMLNSEVHISKFPIIMQPKYHFFLCRICIYVCVQLVVFPSQIISVLANVKFTEVIGISFWN